MEEEERKTNEEKILSVILVLGMVLSLAGFTGLQSAYAGPQETAGEEELIGAANEWYAENMSEEELIDSEEIALETGVEDPANPAEELLPETGTSEDILLTGPASQTEETYADTENGSIELMDDTKEVPLCWWEGSLMRWRSVADADFYTIMLCSDGESGNIWHKQCVYYTDTDSLYYGDSQLSGAVFSKETSGQQTIYSIDASKLQGMTFNSSRDYYFTVGVDYTDGIQYETRSGYITHEQMQNGMKTLDGWIDFD